VRENTIRMESLPVVEQSTVMMFTARHERFLSYSPLMSRTRQSSVVLESMKSFQCKLLIAILLGVSLSNCTSESIQPGEAKNTADGARTVQGNRPPHMLSANILPDPITLDQSISVRADAFDPDGDLITYRYQWRLNDQPITGETHAILSSVKLKRGDQLSVLVTPYDGMVEGSPSVIESTVVNSLPQVTKLLLEPTDVQVGTPIQAQVNATDADDDPIEYRFRWWRNNSEVADGEASELSTEGFVKGDTVVVEVTPADPTEKGKSKLSEPITILNSAPKITSAPPTKIERSRFVYHVTANDPDGDSLIYALEMAPPGMKIDKKTGRIEWQLTGKLAGNYKVRVTATDGDQAHAFQEFDLTFPSPPTSSRLSRNFRVNTRLVTSSAALLE